MPALESPIVNSVLTSLLRGPHLLSILAILLTACIATDAEGTAAEGRSDAPREVVDGSGRSHSRESNRQKRDSNHASRSDAPPVREQERRQEERRETRRESPRSRYPGGQLHDMKLPTASIEVTTLRGGIHRVTVEIAADDHSRSRGLMHRESLAKDEGMLFVFENDAVQTFWMRNTLIPLDMIFVDAEGTIVGIVHEAPPLTETPRFVDKPSRYVLEVPGGWSAERDVRAGDRVMLDSALETLGPKLAR